ncbi:hypothetical protein RclHR1_09870004 [Rhizophagus clarus]|nr:hypothetical protein RclHR1_09870004 [Rhizophagus clarus]
MTKIHQKRKNNFFNGSSDTNDIFNDPLLKDYKDLNIEELKDELQKLEKERDERKLMFENTKKSHSLRDVIDKENIDDNMTMSQNELQNHMIKEILQDGGDREYQNILNAYRLTGKTIFPVKDNRIGLRFETFYNAKFLEPYYIILDQNQENEQLSIFRHTLPHFIPLDELEVTYLNKDMNKFANVVDDYLQAFVTRREEVLTLTKLNRKPRTNNAYTSIEFTVFLKANNDRVDITLTYEDLKSFIPTSAAIYLTREGTENKRIRLQKREREFLQAKLTDAFEKVFGT